MYGLAVIEVISLSGHLWNIDEITDMADIFKVYNINFIQAWGTYLLYAYIVFLRKPDTIFELFLQIFIVFFFFSSTRINILNEGG